MINNTMLRYLPLWAYLGVYIVTCLLVAVVLFVGYSPLELLLEYFSGVVPPANYSLKQSRTFLLLLFFSPALFCVGFWFAVKVRSSPLKKIELRGLESAPHWLPHMVFYSLAGIGLYELLQAGVSFNIVTWLDYGNWVKSRWSLFSKLGYFSFANIYMFVPMCAAWIFISAGKQRTIGGIFIRWMPVLIAALLSLSLFQKKALITTLLIVMTTSFLYSLRVRGTWERYKWIMMAGIGFLATTYMILIVLPVYLNTSKTAEEVLTTEITRTAEEIRKKKEYEISSEAANKKVRIAAATEILGPDRSRHILLYALLAPLTRTSVSAMYYPTVFPELRDYYGLDVGQDILGWGDMPDDNRIVWNFMEPNIAGGSVAAPFQFAFYSQVGTTGALILSWIVGLLLGFAWSFVMYQRVELLVSSLLGALLVMLSIHIAIDSLRHSLLASYGMIWGGVFIGFICLISRFFMNLHSPKTS
jgi:hypothetical protein